MSEFDFSVSPGISPPPPSKGGGKRNRAAPGGRQKRITIMPQTVDKSPVSIFVPDDSAPPTPAVFNPPLGHFGSAADEVAAAATLSPVPHSEAPLSPESSQVENGHATESPPDASNDPSAPVADGQDTDFIPISDSPRAEVIDPESAVTLAVDQSIDLASATNSPAVSSAVARRLFEGEEGGQPSLDPEGGGWDDDFIPTADDTAAPTEIASTEPTNDQEPATEHKEPEDDSSIPVDSGAKEFDLGWPADDLQVPTHDGEQPQVEEEKVSQPGDTDAIPVEPEASDAIPVESQGIPAANEFDLGWPADDHSVPTQDAGAAPPSSASLDAPTSSEAAEPSTVFEWGADNGWGDSDIPTSDDTVPVASTPPPVESPKAPSSPRDPTTAPVDSEVDTEGAAVDFFGSGDKSLDSTPNPSTTTSDQPHTNATSEFEWGGDNGWGEGDIPTSDETSLPTPTSPLDSAAIPPVGVDSVTSEAPTQELPLPTEDKASAELDSAPTVSEVAPAEEKQEEAISVDETPTQPAEPISNDFADGWDIPVETEPTIPEKSSTPPPTNLDDSLGEKMLDEEKPKTPEPTTDVPSDDGWGVDIDFAIPTEPKQPEETTPVAEPSAEPTVPTSESLAPAESSQTETAEASSVSFDDDFIPIADSTPAEQPTEPATATTASQPPRTPSPEPVVVVSTPEASASSAADEGLAAKIGQLEAEKEALQGRCKELVDRWQSFQQTLDTETQQQQAEIASLHSQIQQLHQERDLFRSQGAAASAVPSQGDNNQLESAKAALRKQQEALLQARAELEKEKALLSQTKHSLDQTASATDSHKPRELLAVKLSLEQTVSDLKNKLTLLQRDKERMEAERAEALQASQEAKIQAQSLLLERDVLANAKEQLAQEKREMDERNNLVVEQLRAKQSSQAGQMPEGVVENSPAYKKILELETTNEQLEEEIHLLRRQQKLNNEALASRLQGIHHLKEEIEKIKAEHSIELGNAASDKRELESQLQDFEGQVIAREKTLVEIQQQQEESEVEFNKKLEDQLAVQRDLSRQIEALHGTNAQLTAQLSLEKSFNVDARRDELVQGYDKVTQELSVLKAEQSETHAALHKAKQDNAKLTGRNEELTKGYEQAIQQAATLQTEQTQAQATLRDLESQNRQLTERNKALTGQLDELKQMYEQLKVQHKQALDQHHALQEKHNAALEEYKEATEFYNETTAELRNELKATVASLDETRLASESSQQRIGVLEAEVSALQQQLADSKAQQTTAPAASTATPANDGWGDDFDVPKATGEGNDAMVQELTQERDLLFEKFTQTSDLLRKTEDRLKQQLEQAKHASEELATVKDKLEDVHREKRTLAEELAQAKAQPKPATPQKADANPLAMFFGPAPTVKEEPEHHAAASNSSKSDEEWEAIITELKEEKADIEAQAMEIKSMFELRDQEYLALRSELEELKKAQEGSDQSKNNLQAELADLNAHVSAAKSTPQAPASEDGGWDDFGAAASQTASATARKAEELATAVSELTSKVESLIEERDALKELLDQQNSASQAQKESDEERNTAVAELKAQLETLTQERDSLAQERDGLMEKASTIPTGPSDMEVALNAQLGTASAQLEALTEERNSLAQDRDSLAQERDSLAQERETLASEVVSLKEAAATPAGPTEKEAQLTAQIEQLSSQLESVSEERNSLKELADFNKMAPPQPEGPTQKELDLAAQLETLSEERDSLKELLQQKEAASSATNDGWGDDFGIAQPATIPSGPSPKEEELAASVEKLTSDLESMTEERDSLKELLQQKESSGGDGWLDFGAPASQSAPVSSGPSQKEEELTATVERLQAQLEAVNNDREFLRGRLDQLASAAQPPSGPSQDEVDRLATTVDKLTSDLESMTEERDSLKELLKQNETSTAANDGWSEDFSAPTAVPTGPSPREVELEATVEKLTGQVESLTEERDALKEIADMPRGPSETETQLSDTVAQLNAQVKSLAEERDSIRQAHTENSARHSAEVESLVGERDALQGQVQALQASAAKEEELVSQLEALSEERDALQGQVQTLQASSTKAEGLASQLESLTEERDSLKELLQQKESSSTATNDGWGDDFSAPASQPATIPSGPSPKEEELAASVEKLTSDLKSMTEERDSLKQLLQQKESASSGASDGWLDFGTPAPSAPVSSGPSQKEEELTAAVERLQAQLEAVNNDREFLRGRLDQIASAAQPPSGPSQDEVDRLSAQVESLTEERDSLKDLLKQNQASTPSDGWGDDFGAPTTSAAHPPSGSSQKEEELRATVEELTSQVQDLTGEAQALSQQNKALTIECQGLVGQLRAMESQLSSVDADRNAQFETASSLNAQVSQLTEELTQLQQAGKEMADFKALLETENATSQQVIVQLQASRQSLAHELADLRQVHEKLQAQHQTTVSGHESHTASQVASLEHQVLELQQKVERKDLELRQTKEAFDAKVQEFDQLTFDGATTQQTIAQLQAMSQATSIQLAELQLAYAKLQSDQESSLTGQESQVSRLASQVTDLERKLREQEDQLDAKTIALQRAQTDLAEVEANYREQVVAADTFMSEASASRQQVLQLEEKIRVLSSTNSQLTEELDLVSNQSKELATSLSRTKQQLQTTTSSSESKAAEYLQTLTQAQTELSALTQQRAQLLDSHAMEMEALRKDSEDEETRHQLILDDLTQEKEALETRVQHLNQEVSKMNGKLITVQQELDEHKWSQSQAVRGVASEKDKLAQEVDKLSAQLASLKEESQLQLQEVTTRVDEHIANAEKLRKERNELEEQVLYLKQQVYRVGIEREAASEESRSTLASLRQENEGLAVKYQEEAAKHSTTMQSLLQRIEQMQLQNQELTRQSTFEDQLKEQLVEKDKQIKLLLDAKDDLVQRLVAKSQDAQTPIEQLVESKSQLSTDVSALKKQLDLLKAENTKLKERFEVEDKSEQFAKLNTAFEIIRREKEELVAQTTQLKKQVDLWKEKSEQTIGGPSQDQHLQKEKQLLSNLLYTKTMQLDAALKEKAALLQQLSKHQQTSDTISAVVGNVQAHATSSASLAAPPVTIQAPIATPAITTATTSSPILPQTPPRAQSPISRDSPLRPQTLTTAPQPGSDAVLLVPPSLATPIVSTVLPPGVSTPTTPSRAPMANQAPTSPSKSGLLSGVWSLVWGNDE